MPMSTLLVYARALANTALVFEFSEDSQVDPDLAIQSLEQMASDLQRLSPDDQRALTEAFRNLSSDYAHPAHAAFVAGLGGSLGLAGGEWDLTDRE
ncbi:hypothetical protein ACQ859_23485 [Roseateles chitinivorans]|uniref:hypothetical protein n=1 Tax=Roseateles chitinivorans TaxID=2917965 RepID=UPI003D663C0C